MRRKKALIICLFAALSVCCHQWKSGKRKSTSQSKCMLYQKDISFNRSLGATRAQTFSCRTFRLIDFVLHARRTEQFLQNVNTMWDPLEGFFLFPLNRCLPSHKICRFVMRCTAKPGIAWLHPICVSSLFFTRVTCLTMCWELSFSPDPISD